MHERRQYVPVDPLFTFLEQKAIKSSRKADLHLHTNWTDGTLSPEKMVDSAMLAGLNAIAITDHNTTLSSDIAVDYALQNNLHLEVVRGVEISSKDGHVLAINLEGDVKPHLPLRETIKEVHMRNGLAIIAHPNLRGISSVSLNLLGDIINSDDPELYVDGVEVFNASEERMRRIAKLGTLFREKSSRVREFAKTNILNPKLGALLGNSDGHTQGVGFGVTAYDCESILDAIRNRDTIPMSAYTSFREDLLETTRMGYSVIRSHLIGRI